MLPRRRAWHGDEVRIASTRRAIGRYLPGARTEAKAEAAIDNLLVLLRETRKSLRAVARLRGGVSRKGAGGPSASRRGQCGANVRPKGSRGVRR